ncbi:MAG: hypothetical protein GX334_02430 [Firmicutes bacterium]|nr:hypothetical protein [Bacillota bacterium]
MGGKPPVIWQCAKTEEQSDLQDRVKNIHRVNQTAGIHHILPGDYSPVCRRVTVYKFNGAAVIIFRVTGFSDSL